MNLNSVLFPAPTPSYTLETLRGKLVWIPKLKKKSSLLSHSNTSLLSVNTRSNSTTLSYDTPMLKHKRTITVMDPDQKPKKLDIEQEEVPISTLKTDREPAITKIQLTPACLKFSNYQKMLNSGDTSKNRIPSLKLHLFDTERSQTLSERKKDEDSVILEEINEQPSLSNTMHFLNRQYPRNTINSIERKSSRYIPPQQVDQNSSDECNLSQTSFDLGQTDEFSSLQQNSARTMVKYPTRTFSNPNMNPKSRFSHAESKIQAINPTLLKKSLNCTMSFHSPIVDHDIFSSTSSSTKLKVIHYNSEPMTAPKQNCSSKFSMEIERYIPCMLLIPAANSDKIMIYFHGNGEDINLTHDLMTYLRNSLIINVIAMEYPGYGIYDGSPSEKTIIQDAEAVYDYLTEKLKIKPKNILLYGRSIGTGPAAYLASQKEVGALVLMSAFTSIRAAVKDVAGKWAQYFIKERFNNLEAIPKVKCPTFFVHGQQDKLIPYSHSLELHNVCGGASELLLPKDMDHVEFDFYEDFTYPLMRFLQRCAVIDEGKSPNRIMFPKTLFNPPHSFLNAYRQKKDAMKKRDRASVKRSYDYKLSADAGLFGSKLDRRSLLEY